ncbi:MAG: hypothetical protein V3S68_04670 [Dehalococcoidia bacterium]
MNAAEAAKEIILEVLATARAEGDRLAAELGRPLTDAEVGQVATMVEGQFRQAMAMARLGGR